MVVVWSSLPRSTIPESKSMESIEEVTLKLFLRQPSTLQGFEDLCKTDTLNSPDHRGYKNRLQLICDQARAKQLYASVCPDRHISVLTSLFFLPQPISSHPATSFPSFRGRPQLLKVFIIHTVASCTDFESVFCNKNTGISYTSTVGNPVVQGCEDATHIDIPSLDSGLRNTIIPSDPSRLGDSHVNAIHTCAPGPIVHPALSKFHRERDPTGAVANKPFSKPELDGERRHCGCEE